MNQLPFALAVICAGLMAWVLVRDAPPEAQAGPPVCPDYTLEALQASRGQAGSCLWDLDCDCVVSLADVAIAVRARNACVQPVRSCTQPR